LLQAVAKKKGQEMLANKPKRLPSPTFVSNYLQSFRPKPLPEGLDDSEIEEESGKGQLRKGLSALKSRTTDGYNEAFESFKRALELGDLDEHEALAYNMRGTFRYMIGETEDALSDLTTSVNLDQTMTQSYVKRASMQLEKGVLI
jgi:mitochondrial import receptor subunit TOM70